MKVNGKDEISYIIENKKMFQSTSQSLNIKNFNQQSLWITMDYPRSTYSSQVQ
jgi:hypothetical protein